MSKLSTENIRQIITLYYKDGLLQREIAQKYDICEETVRNITLGKKHHRACAKLNENVVREIRSKYCKRKITLYKLAKIYCVSYSTIWDIIHYQIWKHI